MSINKVLFIFILTIAISFGCASFPGKELPTYTNDQITKSEKKIITSFDVKSFDVFGENKRYEPTLAELIQNTLNKSLIIDQLKPNASEGEYHCTFYFRAEPDNPGLTNVNAIFSGFTLLVLPIYDRHNYSLTIDVKQGPNVIKTYTYRDHMNTWIEIFLLVVQSHYWPTDIEKSLIDNMLINFVHDFYNDFKLGALIQQDQDFKLPAQPDKNNALIYVVRPSNADKSMGVSVFLDNKADNSKKGYIIKSEYIYFAVTPGKHQIYTKHLFNDWDEVTVEPKSGDVLFVRQDMQYLLGHKNPHASLNVIDTQEGIYQIRNSRLGYITDPDTLK